jgi:dihydropteroate synthase
VATHIRLAPRVADPEPVYPGGLVPTVLAFLEERARRARSAGIPSDAIILDAGLDLGKTPRMSLELLRTSDRIAALGHPVLLSASNKRFLGELYALDVDERRLATVAAHALGITLGCRVLRAHDVRGTRRVADVMAAILAAGAHIATHDTLAGTQTDTFAGTRTVGP